MKSCRVFLHNKSELKKNKMKKNIGTVDKVIRILIAVVVVALYFANVISGTLAVVLLVLSAVLVVTSLVSVCPIYLLLSLSSRKK
jgi:hypothetical protein